MAQSRLIQLVGVGAVIYLVLIFAGVAPSTLGGVANATANVSNGSVPAFNVSNFSTGVDTTVESDAVERAVHREVNRVRSDHGLQALQWDSDLHDAAEYHSQDMAEREYFSHTSPEGEDFSDRYRRFGVECRVDTGGGTYLTGAENIVFVPASEHGYNETRIAEAIVASWMGSAGHRRNILQPAWRSEGIGVAVAEVDGGTRVYATQNFC